MALSSFKVLLAVNWMVCVRFTESQAPNPAPTLKFMTSVNKSDIQLYSSVGLVCTSPSGAPYPVIFFVGFLQNATQTPEKTQPLLSSNTITSAGENILINLEAKPGQEGNVVCWYQSTRSGLTNPWSDFSNSLMLVISSLPPPKLTLTPSLIPMGGNYKVACISNAGPAINFTMSLYYRTLPDSNFTLLGSLMVTGSSNSIYSQQTNAVLETEFVCSMEMLYNGRVLFSPLSKIESATPEELPVRLWMQDRGESCLGSLDIKLKGNWVPVCHKEINTQDTSSAAAATAKVVCRDLGCGSALMWKAVSESRHVYTTGGVNCSGRELKIKDCPMSDVEFCTTAKSLFISCSDALPPPKLSVVSYGPSSKVYVSSKELVKISCTFDSVFMKPSDSGYMVFRRTGFSVARYYTYPGSAMALELSAPVLEGEYDCVFLLNTKAESFSLPSNSVFIQIYNPPNPVPIVAGILTTVAGLAILLYICILKPRTEETDESGFPTNPLNPEITQANIEVPTNDVSITAHQQQQNI